MEAELAFPSRRFAVAECEARALGQRHRGGANPSGFSGSLRASHQGRPYAGGVGASLRALWEQEWERELEPASEERAPASA